MIKIHRLLITGCFSVFISSSAFSEAPVVDISENFAMMEEQPLNESEPLSQNSLAFNEAPPLANNMPEENNDREFVEEDEVNTPPLITEENERPLAYDNAGNSDSYNNVQLLDRVQTLQEEVQELRGLLEVQAHDLKLLQQQQLAFYKDLDARIINSAGSSDKNRATNLSTNDEPRLASSSDDPIDNPVKSKVMSKKEKVNPANEQISYLAAYELIKNKKYEEALSALNAFVQNYPESGYAANAQYWLGELYLVQKNYQQAISHFDTVLQHYPSSSKSAASLLKKGYALAATGEKEEARQHLQHVITNYPDTNAAQLASAKLQSMGG